MVAILTLAAVGLQIAPSSAAETSLPFEVESFSRSSRASGSVTLYNRSVRIQGRVSDNSFGNSGYSQVRFDFYLDSLGQTPRYATTTRTASFHGSTDHNF